MSNSNKDKVERRNKIAALVSDVVYYKNEKDREEVTDSFNRSTLTIEEIDSIVSPLKNNTNADIASTSASTTTSTVNDSNTNTNTKQAKTHEGGVY